MTSLRAAGQRELSEMLKLRQQNRAKLERACATYCVCHRDRSGMMVQCLLCCDLFHGNILYLRLTIKNNCLTNATRS